MGKSRRKAKGAKVKAAANPLGLEEDAGLDAASASAARRQFEGIDSLNPSTREVACGAVASLFVSTEHGGEVERRAVHAGRIKWLKAIGMVPKLVRAVNDSHLSARVHALGAVRCAEAHRVALNRPVTMPVSTAGTCSWSAAQTWPTSSPTTTCWAR